MVDAEGAKLILGPASPIRTRPKYFQPYLVRALERAQCLFDKGTVFGKIPKISNSQGRCEITSIRALAGHNRNRMNDQSISGLTQFLAHSFTYADYHFARGTRLTKLAFDSRTECERDFWKIRPPVLK